MSKRIEITPANKCSHCSQSKCCRYITQSMDAPRSIRDFDELLWQISHDHVHVFKDDEGWYLLFMQPCTHLQTDGRCGIYEKRPFICREHENDYCEYDVSLQDSSELFFHNYQELETYCRGRFARWDQRFE